MQNQSTPQSRDYVRFFVHYSPKNGPDEEFPLYQVFASVEKIPETRGPKGKRSGRPPAPEWIEDIKSALRRDIDDAQTSLREVEFLFDKSRSPTMEAMIRPRGAGTKKFTQAERNSQCRALVAYATAGTQLGKAARQGSKERKALAGTNSKAELSRRIRSNIPAELKAVDSEQTGHDYARSWYLRLHWLNKSIQQAETLLDIGKRPEVIEYVKDKRLPPHIDRELLKNRFVAPPQLAAVLSLSSGINMADIWPHVCVFRSELETFAALGRAMLGESDLVDDLHLTMQLDCVERGPHRPVNLSKTIILKHELMQIFQFLAMEYNALVKGAASPRVRPDGRSGYQMYHQWLKEIGELPKDWSYGE